MLPRLPAQVELIALKLKRKLKYKGHYMYDYVSFKKLVNQLKWLKANNPLYTDVNVNGQWINEAKINDSDMFHGLVRQPQSTIMIMDLAIHHKSTYMFMMYKQNVIPCNKLKYRKVSNEILNQVLILAISNDVKSGYAMHDIVTMLCLMVMQAKASNLYLDNITLELSTLNTLELRLRIPFMKMVVLPSGKQRSIQGPAVNIPFKLDSLCTMLPRLPAQVELIALKLKRKLKYKGHYMYDYVSFKKLVNQLKWLKANNPLYTDVNGQWINEAKINDSDMGLVRQPQSTIMIMIMDLAIRHKSISKEIVQIIVNLWSMNPAQHIVNSRKLNNNTNNLPTAYRLVNLAREHGFTVHDVANNGNCLAL